MDLVMERDRIQYLDDSWNVLAEVTFPVVEPGVVEINRTFVDESLRGQGVAGQLMGRAVLKPLLEVLKEGGVLIDRAHGAAALDGAVSRHQQQPAAAGHTPQGLIAPAPVPGQGSAEALLLLLPGQRPLPGADPG